MTTILTKKKDTTGAPAPGDLTNAAGGAELAVNTFDKRLYTKDSGGNVVEVGTNPTELQIDNINVNGNTITSTNTDGNIDLTPNGTGEVNITKVDIDSGAIDNTTIGGATPAAGNFTTVDATNVEVTNIKAKDGTAAGSIADATGVVTFASTVLTTTDINGGSVDAVTLGTNSPVTEAQIDNVNINGNTISSTDTDGDLVLTPDGAGDLVLDGLNWPQADGTLDQALTTNGSGQLAWSTVAGSPGGSDTQIQYNNAGSFGGASGLVTDGSNLTLNAQGDLRFADSDSSNWVAFQAPATIASNVTWTLPSADGTSGQFLSTDGSGALSWATASGGGGGGGTSVTVTQVTATASQTTFNVTYTVGQLSVYLNGALLASADYTATNGTSVVLASGAANGDIFTALAYSTVTTVSQGDTSIEVTDTGSNGTITFDTDGSERMRIDSAGDVGIGTNNPTARLHVQESTFGGTPLFERPTSSTNAASGAARILATSSGDMVDGFGVTQAFLIKDTAGVDNVIGAIGAVRSGADNSGALSFQSTSTGITAERARITPAGELLVGTTSTTANGGVLQVSNGITFPATQSACSDANTLDDYEEGTFTPIVKGSSSAGTGTYTDQNGFYTKIGNLVTVNVYIAWTAHTGTGFLLFGDLPFTSSSASNNFCAAAVAYVNNITLPANTILTAYNNPNSTNLFVYGVVVGGGGVTQVSMDGSGEIMYALSYRV